MRNFCGYAAPDGSPRAVRTPADWAMRRRQILQGMESAMGAMPDRSKLPPLDVKIDESTEGDGFVRLKISYATDDNDRVQAYLLVPKGRPVGQRLPAMVALHQTTPLGKKKLPAKEAPRILPMPRSWPGAVTLCWPPTIRPSATTPATFVKASIPRAP